MRWESAQLKRNAMLGARIQHAGATASPVRLIRRIFLNFTKSRHAVARHDQITHIPRATEPSKPSEQNAEVEICPQSLVRARMPFLGGGGGVTIFKI